MYRIDFGIAAGMALALAACGGSGGDAPAAVAVPASVSAASSYTVSVFAQAPGKSATPPTCDATSPNCFTKPDSIVELGTGSGATVFVAYQGGIQPTGVISSTNTTEGTNQVVQYDLTGKQLKAFTVPGHNDGLMVYDSHTLWAGVALILIMPQPSRTVEAVPA